MKHLPCILGLLALVIVGCKPHEPSATTVQSDSPSTAKSIKVTSPELASGQIPLKYSAYGQGSQPNIYWDAAPAGTKSFAILVEDPDAPGSTPFVHLAVINVPATARSYPPGGTILTNSAGTTAWYPPKPPDSKPHHYHFELLALNTLLPSSVQTTTDLKNATKNHVLAQGELIATFTKP